MNYTDYDSFTMDYSDFTELCMKDANREFRLWFMPIFFSITCFFGLTGNLLVILTFFYFSRLKTMTDVYLLNLSFADLLFALSLPFWAANSMAEWVLGLVVCKAMHTIYKVSFYSSMFLLSFISVDRYWAIASPFKYERKMTHRVAFVMIGVAWTLSILISFIPVQLNWHRVGEEEEEEEEMIEELVAMISRNFTNSSNVNTSSVAKSCVANLNKTYAISSSLISFYIPVVIMITTGM